MHAIAFEEAWRVYLAAARYMPPPAPAVVPQRIAGVLDVAADFDVLVFDAYGVLNNGNRPIAPALAAMRALRDEGKAVSILTNDASGDKEAIAAGHRGRGYDISAADITAGIDLLPETLAGLPDTAGFGVMAHFGLPYPDLLGPMVRLDSDEAAWDAVDGMIFLDAAWTMAQRDMLVRSQQRRPRPMIACNPDVACPIEDALSAEPGYFLHAVTEATGVAVTWLGVRGHEPGATLTMPHPYWRPVRQRTVRANRAWQWVSEVKAGNILRISADGVWSWNGVDSAGPGGDEAGWHALYGRLGPDGEPFLIGSGQWLIARENGVLSMQMEDTYRTDNTGVVSVSIDAFDPNSTAMRQPHLFGSTGREAPTVDDDVGLLFSDDQLQPPYTYHPTDACALAEQFLSAAQAVEGELAVALARRAVDLAGPHERGVEIADAATALLPTEPTEPAPWKRGEWIDLLAPLTADRLPDRIRPAVGGGLELLSCPKEYVVGFRLPVAVKGAFVLEIRATPLHRAANFHISLATDDSRSYQEIALPDANREVLIRVEGTAASEGGIETIFVDGEQIDVDDPRAYAPHSDDNPTPLGDQFYLMADPTSFLIHSARLMAEDADPLLVPPPAQPWSEFSVRANAKSTPTLGLHRGDRVEVEATGHYWTPWTGRGQMAIADADGLLAGGNDSVGYLEGRIGDGEFFRIGSRLAFTADADGVLHLRMRDDDRTDNAGQLYVKIRILR